MAKIDIPTKRLIQIRPMDWVRVILPECDEVEITEMRPDKVPRTESKLDALFWIRSNNEQFILNIEPQGYLDPAMPARMLRYRSDVWEYTISKGLATPSIKQVVIFFYPQHDNKKNYLEDTWQERKTLAFEYEVIKVWEMDRDPVLQKKLLGLYPLLPLMERGPGETPDQAIEAAVNIIQTVEEEALKADLLAVMSILAGERFSSKLVRKYVRREMLMKSTLFKEWVEEEREEIGISKTRENIIELLTEKFDFVPSAMKGQLAQVNDQVVLDSLLRKIIRVERLEEFGASLEKVVR